MDERTARLESTVDELRLAVLSLQKRIDVLESQRLAGPAAEAGALVGTSADSQPGATPARLSLRDQRDPIFALSLIGRLFLVLAGGFFLRAMTEAGVLAPPVGIASAFTYGLVWLFMADRAARRGQWLSAVFHAAGAAMVAFPLLVEATIRFKVLTGTNSALVIAVLTAGLLIVAWRQRLYPVAWIAVIGAIPTSAVLLVQTGVVVPFAVYLIAFGVATLWLDHSLGWSAICWPVALAADAVVAGVTLRAVAPESHDPPRVALLLQAALLGAYLLGVAFSTLVRGRKVTPFEVVQSAAALLVGFGGAAFLAQAGSGAAALLGAASMAFGAACYGTAVGLVARREDHRRNLYFYTTLALVLVLAGPVLVLGKAWLGVVFAALAVLAVWCWSRFGQPFMLLHGSAYIVAAVAASGALAYCASELLGEPSWPWTRPGAAVLVVLLAGAVSAWLAAARPTSDDGALARTLRLVVILACVWLASGCLVGYLAPVTGRSADGSVDVGALATVRTGVLALGTLLVAWIGRHPRFREWGWLVYPLLVGIGLKMVAQDFKYSRPATLFIALALYGTALIVAPRLRRGRERLAARPQDA